MHCSLFLSEKQNWSQETCGIKIVIAQLKSVLEGMLTKYLQAFNFMNLTVKRPFMYFSATGM